MADTSTAPRLPGISSARQRIGRHRRALDAVAADVRRNGRRPLVEQLITIARGHADSADRLERDPEASEHTLNRALVQLREAMAELRPFTSDDLNTDPLADALAAALRDSSQA